MWECEIAPHSIFEYPSGAKLRDHTLFMDGREQDAVIYERSGLKAGDKIVGPAIVVEMDSTTLVLSGHVAEIDRMGNILIMPARGSEGK